MLKFIKENWLIAVISGATGSVITLVSIFVLHVKPQGSTAWIPAIISLISAVIVCFVSYLTNKSLLVQKNIQEHEIDDKKYMRELIFSLIDETDVKNIQNTKIETLWQLVEKIRLFVNEQNPKAKDLCTKANDYIRAVEVWKIAEGANDYENIIKEKNRFNSIKEMFAKSVADYFNIYTKTP